LKSIFAIPQDLLTAKESVYDPCGLECSDFRAAAESAEYDALTFRLNGQFVCYRQAKITPAKTGQFVTLWKRSEAGPIEPFSVTDTIDLVIISTRKDEQSGQFIFPKAVLAARGIISTAQKEGKRGFRVYPPWDIPGSKQAQQTQAWQLPYFLEGSANCTSSRNRALTLLLP